MNYVSMDSDTTPKFHLGWNGRHYLVTDMIRKYVAIHLYVSRTFSTMTFWFFKLFTEKHILKNWTKTKQKQDKGWATYKISQYLKVGPYLTYGIVSNPTSIYIFFYKLVFKIPKFKNAVQMRLWCVAKYLIKCQTPIRKGSTICFKRELFSSIWFAADNILWNKKINLQLSNI